MTKENINDNLRIDKFRDEYEFLSNFFPCQIEYEGLYYLNAEAAFQAQKCRDDSEKMLFCGLTAVKAKRKGRQVKLRDDWEDVKIEIMEKIVRAKFTQNQSLTEKLLNTDNKELIEGNTFGDTYWGVDEEKGGENNLGKILMKIREEIRNKQ